MGFWTPLVSLLLLAQPALGVGEDPYPDPYVDGLEWIAIPAGEFTMGETDGPTKDQTGPEHTVYVDSYNISRTHITNAMYVQFLNKLLAEDRVVIEIVEDDLCGFVEAVLGGPDEYYAGLVYQLIGGFTVDEAPENICYVEFDKEAAEFKVRESDDGYDVANWPTVFVHWYGAYAFAREYGYWLPTDAQWEHAARADEYDYVYPTETGVLNTAEANWKDHVGHPTPVCSYPPNAWGVCDMAGNAWEWIHDWWYDARVYHGDNYYDESPYENPLGANATEPSLDAEGGPVTAYTEAARLVRGCSYNYHNDTCRTVFHRWDYPYRGNDHFGFRIVDNGPDYWRFTTAPPDYDNDDDTGGGGGDDDDDGSSSSGWFVAFIVLILAVGLGVVYRTHSRKGATHQRLAQHDDDDVEGDYRLSAEDSINGPASDPIPRMEMATYEPPQSE